MLRTFRKNVPVAEDQLANARVAPVVEHEDQVPGQRCPEFAVPCPEPLGQLREPKRSLVVTGELGTDQHLMQDHEGREIRLVQNLVHRKQELRCHRI